MERYAIEKKGYVALYAETQLTRDLSHKTFLHLMEPFGGNKLVCFTGHAP
jgi:hypothetical protein